MPEGYCVKERKKVEIKDAKQVTMKNGRPAIQGVCPDCGTKIFKIGKLEGLKRRAGAARRCRDRRPVVRTGRMNRPSSRSFRCPH